MKSSVVFQLTSTGFGSSLQDKRGGKKRKTKGRSMLYVSLSKRIEVFKKKKSFSFNQKKKKKNLDCHSNTCLLNCILLCLHLLGGTCLGALSVGVSTEPCRLCCARAVMFPPREPTLSLLKCHHIAWREETELRFLAWLWAPGSCMCDNSLWRRKR